MSGKVRRWDKGRVTVGACGDGHCERIAGIGTGVVRRGGGGDGDVVLAVFGYPVGAAVRTASGRIFAGCNVENASYPLGSCAEAGAIAAMVFGGDRQIVEVVTVTEGDRPGTPCGGCRQRLREFSALSVPVFATTATGAVIALTIDELLPESFGPEFLDVGRR